MFLKEIQRNVIRSVGRVPYNKPKHEKRRFWESGRLMKRQRPDIFR
jgi:hypothetical protein